MKLCPYCAEEIHADAKKCKHCGEFLDERLRSERATQLIRAVGGAQPSGYGRSLRHAGWIVFGVGIVAMLTVSILVGLLIAVVGGLMDNRGKAIEKGQP